VLAGDERVLALLEQSRPEAIEVLYDRYGGLAYSLAYRVLQDAAAAEDVVQEAFLSIWRRSDSYRTERGSLRTWLCSIVHHRALDRLRGRSGRARGDLPLEPTHADTTSPDTWETVSQQIERDHVRHALVGLPADQRQTLELAYYGGYSQSEISTLMSVPLGTVKGRTRAGLRRLRDVLETQGVVGEERW
jgi:RNA polymerase sigma-70 factor (ECF subfamily)